MKERLNGTLEPGDLQQDGKCLVTNSSKIVADHHAHGSEAFAVVLLKLKKQHWKPSPRDKKREMPQTKPVLYSIEFDIVRAGFFATKSQQKTFEFGSKLIIVL